MQSMPIKGIGDEARAGIRFVAPTDRIDGGEYLYSFEDAYRAIRLDNRQFGLSDKRTDCTYTISGHTRVELEQFKRADGYRYARLFVEVDLCYGSFYDTLGFPHIRAWSEPMTMRRRRYLQVVG